MELATFSRLFGRRFILPLLAALMPAARPFWTQATLSRARLPVGFFDSGHAPPASSESLTLERRGPGRYRLTLADESGSYRFDAVAFDLPGPGGRPATFLDLRPIERPAAATWPRRTRHLAVRVEWRPDSRGGGQLSLSAPRKTWLDAHAPTIGASTARLQRLLRRALADRAFEEAAAVDTDGP